MEFAGARLPAGAAMLVSLLGTNRDPDRFPEPDVLDLRRADTRHLSLGHGLHHCLGASLARLEGQIAITGLFTRYPRLRLAGHRDTIRYRENIFLRSLNALPVLLD